MALITAAEARDYIRGLSGTAEDALLDKLIARCGVLFATHCGFPAASAGAAASLEQTTYTRYHDGPGGNTLHLDVLPVLSVTSVHDSPDRTYGSSDLIAAADYEVHGNDGLVVLKTTGSTSGFSTAYRAIKAIYSAGYSTIPDDIKHVACLQVRWWYEGRAIVGMRSVSQTGGSVSVGASLARGAGGGLQLLQEAKEVLRPYRLPSAWLA